MKLKYTAVILFLCLSFSSWSQQVSMVLDTNNILIGDQVAMVMKYQGQKGDLVHWPVINDTLNSKLEVVSKEKIDTLNNEDGMTLVQALLVTSFDTGYHVVPPIRFEYQKKGDTSIYSQETNARLLTVYPIEIDTTQAIKDIKPPIEAPVAFAEVLPWLVGVIIGGLLVALIIILFKRKRKQPVKEPKKFVPQVPPHLWALEEMEKVRLEKLWQNGHLKAYYTKITDVTRKYIELRFGIDAMEMTSDEVLAIVKDRIHADGYSKLNEAMFLADMVKFAKAQPKALEHDLCYNHLVDFINETKQSAPAQEQVNN